MTYKPPTGSNANYLGIPVHLVLPAYIYARFLFGAVFPTDGSSPIDEILVLYLVPAAIGSIVTYRIGVITWPLLAYCAISLLSLAFSNVSGVPQPYAAVYDLVLDLKFFIAFLGLAGLLYRAQTLESAAKWMAIALVTVAVINLPFVFYDAFSPSGIGVKGQRLLYRAGFYQPHGLLFNHVESSWVTLLGAFSAIYLYLQKKTAAMLVLAVFLFVGELLHVSAKEIFAMLLSLTIIAVFSRRYRLILLPIGLIAIISVLLFTPVGQVIFGQINMYTASGNGELVRSMLLSRSLEIARDFFPLGSGGGTFASPPSFQMGYSSIYVDYGFSDAWGASRTHPQFLLDMFWPKFLAQTGFIGLTLYLLAFWICVAPSMLLITREFTPINWLAFSISSSTLVISIASTPYSHEALFVTAAFGAAIGHLQKAQYSGVVPRGDKSMTVVNRQEHEDASRQAC